MAAEKTYCGLTECTGHGSSVTCGVIGEGGLHQCGYCQAKDAKAQLAAVSEKRDYTGTPEEVGAQLAADALGPTINEAMATHHASNVSRLIYGMVAFFAGAVAEHFGPEAAEEMLRGTADIVSKNREQLRNKVN